MYILVQFGFFANGNPQLFEPWYECDTIFALYFKD